MTKDEATELVNAWVSEWRLYLDGGLHIKARDALVARIVEASGTPDMKPEKRRGRPPKAAAPAPIED